MLARSWAGTLVDRCPTPSRALRRRTRHRAFLTPSGPCGPGGHHLDRRLWMNKLLFAPASIAGLGAAFALSVAQPSGAQTAGASAQKDRAVHFDMVRSAGTVAADCLKGASAKVTIKPTGITETMTIKAQ